MIFRKIRERFMRRRMARERELFRFFDGERFRAIDPWATHRQFDMHDKFIWELGQDVDAGDSEATETVVNACHEIFGTQAWDGASGLTEAEIIGIFVDFLDYIDQLKKKLSAGPTLQPPTDLPSLNSREHQPETTNSCVDSPSMQGAAN